MQLLANAERGRRPPRSSTLRSERSNDQPNVILKMAKDEGSTASLWVAGEGCAKAWILGSVSSRVVAESSCPVIVVK